MNCHTYSVSSCHLINLDIVTTSYSDGKQLTQQYPTVYHADAWQMKKNK